MASTVTEQFIHSTIANADTEVLGDYEVDGDYGWCGMTSETCVSVTVETHEDAEAAQEAVAAADEAIISTFAPEVGRDDLHGQIDTLGLSYVVFFKNLRLAA